MIHQVPGSSAVNWMLLSTELMWVRNSSLWALLMITNVSSTNLFHNKGGFDDDCSAQAKACLQLKISILLWRKSNLTLWKTE